MRLGVRRTHTGPHRLGGNAPACASSEHVGTTRRPEAFPKTHVTSQTAQHAGQCQRLIIAYNRVGQESRVYGRRNHQVLTGPGIPFRESRPADNLLGCPASGTWSHSRLRFVLDAELAHIGVVHLGTSSFMQILVLMLVDNPFRFERIEGFVSPVAVDVQRLVIVLDDE